MFYTRCGTDDWSILRWCNLENKSIHEFLTRTRILRSDFNLGNRLQYCYEEIDNFYLQNLQVFELKNNCAFGSARISFQTFTFDFVCLMESRNEIFKKKNRKTETGRSIIDSKGWVPQKGSTCDIEPRLTDTTKNTACESSVKWIYCARVKTFVVFRKRIDFPRRIS